MIQTKRHVSPQQTYGGITHILERPSPLDVVQEAGEKYTEAKTWPCKRISPAESFSNPAMARSVVVFPQPEGPNRHKICPG